MDNKNKRIFITGNAGAGKTTLAKIISNKLNVPYYSLDQIVWQSGWQVTPEDKRRQLILNLIDKNEWIIEGVSKDALVKAQVIIFLDMPRYLCFIRLICRNYRYLFKSRPELPDHCPEIKIIGRLVKIVWNFKRNVRLAIIDYIYNCNNKVIYHIKTKKDLNACLKEFELN